MIIQCYIIMLDLVLSYNAVTHACFVFALQTGYNMHNQFLACGVSILHSDANILQKKYTIFNKF